MAIPKIGEPARPFRLPSAQGGEVGLDDFKGRHAVILWFTKGMACPFCRQQMSQLKRAHARIKDAGGEILEVTGSAPARAQLYARQFALPFPYLCDPDRRVHEAWGLVKRPHGLGYYAKTFVKGMQREPPPSDFGKVTPALSEFPSLLADEDMGLFIIDRGGTVRYVLAGAYFNEAGPRGLPGPDELVRELQRCAASA